MPAVLAVCAEAGATLHDIGAIVVGAGPGPFTGLRVGMVTAGALGDALAVPVHGVCSLDAIAGEAVRDAAADGPLLVATDARRREVYWAAYDAAGARTAGPYVEAPGGRPRTWRPPPCSPSAWPSWASPPPPVPARVVSVCPSSPHPRRGPAGWSRARWTRCGPGRDRARWTRCPGAGRTPPNRARASR